jgi:spermidine synthase
VSASRSSSIPWLLPLLTVLFFFSGACALVYQVMWLRLLALVFGVTVYAASTVLAGFMAGLAVGSALAGRLAARVTRPLAAFGLVEILVGLTALATPLALELVTRAWVALHPSLPESLAVITVLRFACAFAVLIVPTSLMGATLPLVVKSAVARQESIGGRIGWLYAVNTSGAIVGALVAGFYLISDVGVSLSFRLAAATNIVIGLVALGASRAIPPADAAPAEGAELRASIHGPQAASPDPEEDPSQPRPREALSAAQRRAVLATFALSGAMSLALEIIWFRLLVVLLRPTAYAFTIMLAAVLAGIALGSAAVTPLLRRRWPWLQVLTVVQLAIAVAAVLSFNTLATAEALAGMVATAVSALDLNAYFGPIIATSLAAMLPTTLLLGAAFPVGLALWAGDDPGPHTSRRVGLFYSLNVCGAIAGSTLAGFVLLPALGSGRSLILVAAMALASSMWLAVAQWRDRPNFAGFVVFVAPVIFAMTALNAADPFEVERRRSSQNEAVVWRKEGVQTTVAVHDVTRGTRMRVMYLDGMHQANDSGPTAFVHQRIGALPVMLHPRPSRALVVGLGGGATPGAAAAMGVAVDVVELSGAVVEGSRFFSRINFDLLDRPNVRLRVDDGRNYLLMTRQKYDVITADIILPRHAGAGALYSQEYYQLVRGALADGGLALQWNGGETDFEFKLLMRTFLSVFPHTTLWGDGSLMLGSTRPFTISQSAFEARRRQDPHVAAVFDWDLNTMRRLYVAGPDALKAFVGEGPILTDDRPRIEYFLSLPAGSPPPDLRALAGRFEDVLRP